MESTSHTTTAPSPRSNRLRPITVSQKNRSAMSNGTTILGGIDGRSAEARRFRDIVLALADDLGGLSVISEQDAALIRHAAALQMQSELMQRATVNGEPVNHEQLVRITNSLTRVLNALKARQKPKSTAPSIADIAARHRSGGDSA